MIQSLYHSWIYRINNEDKNMKHIELLLEKNDLEKCIEIETINERKIYLVEREYTQEEYETFCAEQPKWLINRKGSMRFYADSDNGEDAEGTYTAEFDLDPKTAVFDNGKFIGICFCPENIDYSGNGRASFEVSQWGYPGYNIFTFFPNSKKPHLFLFAELDTYKYDDWSLTNKKPDQECSIFLDFN